MLSKKNNEHFYLASSLFCSLLVAIFSIFSIFSEFPTQSILITIGFALTVCNISTFTRRYYSNIPISFVLLFLLFLPVLISWTGLLFLKYLYFIGYPLLLVTLWRVLVKLKFIEIIIIFGAAFLIGVSILSYISQLEGSYMTPLFKKAIQSGTFNLDTIFHIAISNMLQTYQQSSTGIDGLEQLNYHIGSHYYLSCYSKLIGHTGVFSYNIFYILVIIPIYFFVFIQSVYMVSLFFIKKDISKYVVSIYIFIVILYFLVIPSFIGQVNLILFYVSESYLLSMLFLLVSVIVLLDYLHLNIKNKLINYTGVLVLVCLSIFIITVTKISTGILFFLGSLLVIFFKFLLTQKYKSLFLFGILFTLFFLFSYYFANTSHNYSLSISPLHYIKNHSSYLQQKPYYYLIAYIYSIFYCLVRLREKKIFTLRQFICADEIIEVKLILILTIISIFPGLILPIAGGSAGYFTRVTSHLGVLLFLSWLIVQTPFILTYFKKHFFIKKTDISLSYFALSFLVITVLGSIAWDFKNNATQVYKSYKSIKEIPKDEWRSYIISELDSLNKLDVQEKQKLAIRISPTDTLYWNHFNKNEYNRKSISFVVPALSGIMQIDGMPLHQTEVENYGFNDYRKRTHFSDTLTNKQLCKKAKGYIPIVEHIIVYYPSHSTKEICNCN
ncbi:hypothetical protein WAF17_01630 [Bernardetia sp. ABR2-2B]|uniref:hypothetical protein n=1 Tax=Bernardetia sp. ABR2-2B TaxID=3127472 RepID=UPI0030CCE8D3